MADCLQQVLINLIGNAIKFTARGGIRVVVRCQDAEKLTIAVADTRPRISAEQLPDIFEAFCRSSNYAQREHQGAGLGLSIVKEIVTLMNGDISVSSEVGVGPVFIPSAGENCAFLEGGKRNSHPWALYNYDSSDCSLSVYPLRYEKSLQK